MKQCFKRHDEDDEGIYSEEFSSGESDREEDMINYIDERKQHVPYGKLTQKEQVDRLFFMW
jgi:hypothetical protein